MVLRSESVDAFSQFLGWCYFLAWSVSFWPQTLLNFKRRSVQGLSLDFTLYNLTGFSFYTVYCLTKYVEDGRAGAVQSVEPNDIAFGVHAVVATLVCLYQFHAFRAAGRSPTTAVHSYILSVFYVLAAYNLLLVLAAALPWYIPPTPSSSSSSSSYSFIDFLGYGKAAISFIKYTPQAYLNYQRQSTVGWSIVNILLDFTGGALSLSQQCIDAWNRDDGGVLWGNVPKLLLALESIAFDILFMVQHYTLYTDRRDPAAALALGEQGSGEEAPLKKAGGSVDYYAQLNDSGPGLNGRHEDADEKKSAAEVQL